MVGGLSNESLESLDDGTANWAQSERNFKTRWANAKQVKEDIQKQNYEEYRAWNTKVVNANKLEAKVKDFKKIAENGKKIQLVQLDTGYTDHSKVLGRFDLLQDEDFIDGEDARDEMSVGILRHPGHGTRTASIIVGNKSNGRLSMMETMALP